MKHHPQAPGALSRNREAAETAFTAWTEHRALMGTTRADCEAMFSQPEPETPPRAERMLPRAA